MIYGDSLRSCCVAIVVPHADKVKKWAQENGKTLFTNNDLGKDSEDLNSVIQDSVFKKFIMDDMNRIAVENKLSGLEKPKDICLTLDAFSIENNMLTPTFKLKRNIGREVYRAQIDKMYEALVKQGL